MNQKPRIIVTGSAGFIGSNLLAHLKSNGFTVLGIDSYSSYYATSMKLMRQNRLKLDQSILDVDISDKAILQQVFQDFHPEIVINLAAQGGVRASRINPEPYIRTNQLGFLNLLELSKKFGVSRFIYASSSSVYGDSSHAPFMETQNLEAPKSLYALSKIANELIAENFDSPAMQKIGLRFFTVYGPWGRPDMAIFRILASCFLGTQFLLTASLDVKRDFTYVDDVSIVIKHLLTSTNTFKNHEIFNVAGGKPYSLRELFDVVQRFDLTLNVAQRQPDSLDLKLTHGSTNKLRSMHIPVPETTLISGIEKTINWMRQIEHNDLMEWYEYSS